MPLRTGLLRVIDTVSEAFGVLDRPLSAERLVASACRHAGYADFGDMSFMDPLRRFLAACDNEAELSLLGRIATRWDVERFLSNLLRFQSEEARAPAILEGPVTRPIFIAGLPRSGTTFLHRLLMQDPAANRAPLVWETIYPYADRHNRRSSVDDRVERVTRQLRTFERLAPEFRALHPLEANSSQECSEITTMCSAACASIRIVMCRPIGTGWTPLGIWRRTGFIGAFCSTYSTRACRTARMGRTSAGCSNVPTTSSASTPSARSIPMRAWCSCIAIR
jgi:hypothetical protein